MADRPTPEQLADKAYDRYVVEHGPVVTSSAFTELAAKTLHAAAKRAASAQSSSLPSASAATSVAAAGEGDLGAADSFVRGSADAPRSTSRKTKPRAGTRGSSTTGGRSRTTPAGHAGRTES